MATIEKNHWGIILVSKIGPGPSGEDFASLFSAWHGLVENLRFLGDLRKPLGAGLVGQFVTTGVRLNPWGAM